MDVFALGSTRLGDASARAMLFNKTISWAHVKNFQSDSRALKQASQNGWSEPGNQRVVQVVFQNKTLAYIKAERMVNGGRGAQCHAVSRRLNPRGPVQPAANSCHRQRGALTELSEGRG